MLHIFTGTMLWFGKGFLKFDFKTNVHVQFLDISEYFYYLNNKNLHQGKNIFKLLVKYKYIRLII